MIYETKLGYINVDDIGIANHIADDLGTFLIKEHVTYPSNSVCYNYHIEDSILLNMFEPLDPDVFSKLKDKYSHSRRYSMLSNDQMTLDGGDHDTFLRVYRYLYGIGDCAITNVDHCYRGYKISYGPWILWTESRITDDQMCTVFQLLKGNIIGCEVWIDAGALGVCYAQDGGRLLLGSEMGPYWYSGQYRVIRVAVPGLTDLDLEPCIHSYIRAKVLEHEYNIKFRSAYDEMDKIMDEVKDIYTGNYFIYVTELETLAKRMNKAYHQSEEANKMLMRARQHLNNYDGLKPEVVL